MDGASKECCVMVSFVFVEQSLLFALDWKSHLNPNVRLAELACTTLDHTKLIRLCPHCLPLVRLGVFFLLLRRSSATQLAQFVLLLRQEASRAALFHRIRRHRG